MVRVKLPDGLQQRRSAVSSPILLVLWVPVIVGVGIVFPFLLVAAGAVATCEAVEERAATPRGGAERHEQGSLMAQEAPNRRAA
jgi:Na+-transporting methylmalonyl-CoA/oxaloacetate decarboxylase gamma subunit